MLPSLATTDDYTTWTGQAADDTVAAALLRASSMLRAATGQTISRVTDDVYVTRGDRGILLPQVPADLPTLITGWGQSLTGWTMVGQRITGLYGCGPYTITYSHGFATIPDEIIGIVCDAARRAISNPENIRQVGNVVFGAETIGGVSLTADEISRARTALGIGSAVALQL